MASSLRAVAGGVALAASLAGLAYTMLAIERMHAFRRRRTEHPHVLPPMTIFKPLHGLEPNLEQNLRSFCDQDYPEFQVIFCAAASDDPALAIARELQQEFSHRAIAIAAGSAPDAPNPKIANVLGAYAHADHDLLVIADSDVRVERGYLRALAARFDDPRAVAVTCLYGGIPRGGVVSELGALYVNDAFAPSVLVAQALEPLTYCFGATMAVRRAALEAAGGLEALSHHLGDDYLLGQLATRNGGWVSLSSALVHTCVAETTLRALWRREVRWARTIRAARPAGFAGSVVTHVLPLAAIYALLAPSPAAFALTCLAAAARALLHYESRATFAQDSPAMPWLIPARDVMSLAVWAAGLFGDAVQWHSADYRIEAGGRMSGLGGASETL